MFFRVWLVLLSAVVLRLFRVATGIRTRFLFAAEWNSVMRGSLLSVPLLPDTVVASSLGLLGTQLPYFAVYNAHFYLPKCLREK